MIMDDAQLDLFPPERGAAVGVTRMLYNRAHVTSSGKTRSLRLFTDGSTYTLWSGKRVLLVTNDLGVARRAFQSLHPSRRSKKRIRSTPRARVRFVSGGLPSLGKRR
jgi:hypothetical protein